MKAGTYKKSFILSDVEIDEFGEWLDSVQDELGVQRQNRIRVHLMVENLLLRIRDSLGPETETTASIERRLGRARLKLVVPGEVNNPLGGSGAELEGWESSLGTAVGLVPQYSYERSTNVLRLVLPTPRMNPVVRIAIAMLIGAALGALGNVLMPDGFRQSVGDLLIDSAYDTWIRLLNAISGPIVFLTVITTMLNARRIDESGGSTVLVVIRYFAISVAVVVLALSLALVLFPLEYQRLTFNRDLVKGLLDVPSNLIPANIVEPFTSSNTQHLLFLAFGLGVVLIQLGGLVDRLKGIIRESNLVGLQVASWVSWFVPIITGTFICLELWVGRTDMLGNIWQPLGIALVISLATILLWVLTLSRMYGVGFLEVVRKLWQPFEIALRSGSLDSSFGAVLQSSTRLLGIDQSFAKLGLPQGLVLFMPVSAIGTITFTLFVARETDIQGSATWYLTAIVMAVVVFVATPPVPGANLLAYVVLFAALSIPEDMLLDAMIFDVVFGIFAGAANQAMLQMEMVFQARRFGMLDLERLRKREPRGSKG